MITKLLSALRKWSLGIVLVYAMALTIVSLVRVNGIPNLGSSFDDKIYHSLAYFLFTLLVFNYCQTRNVINSIGVSAVVVVVYGIIIEVLQHVITTYRTLDIYDMYANILGVALAAVVLQYRHKLKLK